MSNDLSSLKASIDMALNAISQVEADVSVLKAQVEEIDGDYPCMIPGIPGGGGGGASEYRSYFRVINASTTDPDVCKIGVTNGSSEMLDPVGNCGAVKINGERADVAAVTKALSAAGTYYVWIHSWIDAVDGAQAEIIVGAADDDDPPDNPNGGIAFANQLAGRVTVADDAQEQGEALTPEQAHGVKITSITQDYLRGGEHFELLFGDCEGEEIRVTP